MFIIFVNMITVIDCVFVSIIIYICHRMLNPDTRPDIQQYVIDIY